MAKEKQPRVMHTHHCTKGIIALYSLMPAWWVQVLAHRSSERYNMTAIVFSMSATFISRLKYYTSSQSEARHTKQTGMLCMSLLATHPPKLRVLNY